MNMRISWMVTATVQQLGNNQVLDHSRKENVYKLKTEQMRWQRNCSGNQLSFFIVFPHLLKVSTNESAQRCGREILMPYCRLFLLSVCWKSRIKSRIFISRWPVMMSLQLRLKNLFFTSVKHSAHAIYPECFLGKYWKGRIIQAILLWFYDDFVCK